MPTATLNPTIAELARDNEIAATVSIDELMGPYEAIIATDHRWNGWVIPKFTLDTVRQMAADTAKLLADNPGHEDEYDTVAVTDDDTVVFNYGQWGDEEVITPDDRGLYCVGGMYWTWSEAK